MAKSSISNPFFEVSHDIEQHRSGHRISTGNTVLAILRRHYPKHHVTETQVNNASLLAFADEGHAAYSLVPDVKTNFTRKWVRDDASPDGTLQDEVRYACYQYIWKSTEFLVYRFHWRDLGQAPSQMQYILKVWEGEVTTDCKETKALLLEAGAWTSKPHHEVLVFDQGYWSKDADMYNSVQEVRWDRVSLGEADSRCKR